MPQAYPELERSEIERLLTLLDETASTERGLSLSLASPAGVAVGWATAGA
jgi:hypothetical protein